MSRSVPIPVFAGIGTSAANSPQCREQAIADASPPLGQLLLTSCYRAFTTELASLSAMDSEQTNIDLADFSTPISLLSLSSNRSFSNAVISNSFLFLVQSLRYLAYMESSVSKDSHSPPSDIFQTTAEFHMGVLGFSSGILTACVVASSATMLTYITRAVEIYKVALWIGIRVQLHRVQLMAENYTLGTYLPWSLVFVGIGKEAAEILLNSFNEKQTGSRLYLTAILSDKAVTISGRPDTLALFAASIEQNSISTRQTFVHALYHACPAHLATKSQVLFDITRRNIRFPAPSDLIVPLVSTLTGEVISSACSSLSLAEDIVDMILTQPVNWDLVTTSISTRVLTNKIQHVKLINFGPGCGLTKGLERTILSRISQVTVQDVSLTAFPPGPDAIAIIGMAVNMPGAPNTDRLWEILENGVNTVSTIPEYRFNIASATSPDADDPSPHRLNVQTGNFLSNPAAFDNKFFNISPREARNMDPQQRILLHCAHEALENAGYVPDATKCFERVGFGCYIGAATSDYSINLRDEVDVYYSTGTLRSFLSGRISYVMQWSGPSVVVDTACSSSLVAIYQACRALQNSDCNAALAGGVNIITSPDMFIGLERGHFLSPKGQCKPFDASADGYSRSEGCGLFVLKRLADAVNENDRILGVIRGVEVNQSGTTTSITRPDVESQQALLYRLMAKTGVDPARVSVIEAHGTGTQAGDVCEMESIHRVFGSSSRHVGKNPLYVTSVKANIGHLEAASGSSSLAKLLLMFNHGMIPPLVSLEEINPLFGSLEIGGIILNREMVPWASPDADGEERSRMAVLNNFGAAGSNATLLLEEYRSSSSGQKAEQQESEMSLVLAISGKTMGAVEELRSQYLRFLDNPEHNNLRLSQIAYTATARRQVHECRLAVSGSDRFQLMEKLKWASVIRAPSGTPTARVVLVFSGQGHSRYLGIGSQLYKTCPLFKRHIDECESILKSLKSRGMLDIILAREGDDTIAQTEILEAHQTAVFSLEYSLSQLWISWGVEPVAVVGHSLGEYVALVIAGVLPLRSALALVASRARLMMTKCIPNSTGMLAVGLDHTTLTSIMRQRLSIACYNSPLDHVVSGPIVYLQELEEYLDSHVRCKNISVPFGYHSPSMDPILDEITSIARNIVLSPPTIPVISNVLGDVVLAGDSATINSDYFALHCRQPVLFTQGIDAYLTKFGPVDVWIEIGPHASCLPMLKVHPKVTKEARLLPSLRGGQDPWATLTESLAQLYLCDVPISWREVFSHFQSVSCVDLPAHPLSPVDFWIPYQDKPPHSQASMTVDRIDRYWMLHSRTQTPTWTNGRVAIFKTPISLLASFMKGHVVGGRPLCPASVYHELALAGIHLISGEDSVVVLFDIECPKSLVYKTSVESSVVTTVTIADDHSGRFTICSLQDSYAGESLHCRGRYEVHPGPRPSHPLLSNLSPKILGITSEQEHGGSMSESFSTRTIYEVLFPRVVAYSKEYQTIQSITVALGGMEGYAIVRLPLDHDRRKFVVHPVFVDTLLHVAGFLSNFQGDIRDAYLCSHIARIEIIPEFVDPHAKYGVYCHNVSIPEEGTIISEVYAIKLGGCEQVVACIKGAQFRKLRLTSLVRGLAIAAGEDSSLSGPHLRRASTVSIFSETSNTLFEPLVDYCDEVLKVVADVCHIDPLSFGVESKLTSLGVSSAMFVEIFGRLQELVPSLTIDQIRKSRTIEEIVKAVSEASSTSTSGISTAESLPHLVTQTVADACGIDPSDLQMDMDLTSAGMDSLMSIEISTRLQQLFPFLNPAVSTISSCRTICDIIDTLPAIAATEIMSRSRAGSSASVRSRIEEPTVQSLLANVLGLEQMDLHGDTDLHAVGLDSLVSIEALHLLQNEFGVSLPKDFFQTARTPVQVSTEVKNRVGMKLYIASEQPGPLFNTLRLDQPFTRIQVSNSQNSPLFLIHDGSGLVHYYERLDGLERNVFGIHSPRFVSGDLWGGISSMAEEYGKIVLNESGLRPVLLGGWSFGGIVAFEIACQFIRRGLKVKGVLLIDSPSPANHVALSDSLFECAVKLNVGPSGSSEIARLMKAQFIMSSRLLSQYQPPEEGPYPPVAFLRSREGVKLEPEFTGSVPSWLADRSDSQTAVEGFEGLIGEKVKMWDIPGNHFETFMPVNIDEVSRRIADGCEFLDRR